MNRLRAPAPAGLASPARAGRRGGAHPPRRRDRLVVRRSLRRRAGAVVAARSAEVDGPVGATPRRRRGTPARPVRPPAPPCGSTAAASSCGTGWSATAMGRSSCDWHDRSGLGHLAPRAPRRGLRRQATGDVARRIRAGPHPGARRRHGRPSARRSQRTDDLVWRRVPILGADWLSRTGAGVAAPAGHGRSRPARERRAARS